MKKYENHYIPVIIIFYPFLMFYLLLYIACLFFNHPYIYIKKTSTLDLIEFAKWKKKMILKRFLKETKYQKLLAKKNKVDERIKAMQQKDLIKLLKESSVKKSSYWINKRRNKNEN